MKGKVRRAPVSIRVTTPSGKKILVIAAPEDRAKARELARQLGSKKKR